MRKINIICVGKSQEQYLREGIKSYEKKINRYCSLNWHVIKEANYSSGSRESWLESEYNRLSKFLSERSYSIACDEKGSLLSSRELAQLFSKTANSGFSQMDFFIGGAYGLPEKICMKVNQKLSFSPMTFTHQMVRLILIEQIYRAFTILNNENYHHD